MVLEDLIYFSCEILDMEADTSVYELLIQTQMGLKLCASLYITGLMKSGRT
jgi:hypothetical protein